MKIEEGKLAAFALIDLLVTVALMVVLLSLGIPAVSRVRELSKRSVCGVNLAGIGAATRIYADSNKDQWMVPPFKRGAIDHGGIYYLAGTRVNEPPQLAEVGYDRQEQTTSETPLLPNFGSDTMSVTRSYWMLVRSGDVSVKQFVCPSIEYNTPDPTVNVDLYYDFTSYLNISYGYQVPFGPRETQPREGADPRKIFAADKGPFYFITIPTWDWSGEDGGPIDLDDSPKYWMRFNSPNHGGYANSDGQNVLFSDTHVSFVRIPAVGVDNDNIYTLMTNEWSALPYNRIHGNTPHEPPTVSPYPGQNAFGDFGGAYSSTDSLIYP